MRESTSGGVRLIVASTFLKDWKNLAISVASCTSARPFLGHSQPPAPENSSTNTEPSGNGPDHANSQGGGNGDPANRPSSAPLDINSTHRRTLMSLFRLSPSLPPRSESTEPNLGGQERMQEIQRKLDIVNEDLANRNKDLDELREVVDLLKDQVA